MVLPRYPDAAFTTSIRRFPRQDPAFEYVKGLKLDGLGVLPTFAADASAKTGAKKYFVGGYRAVFKYMKRVTDQHKAHFYELLRPDVPLRLYYDVDVAAPCDTFDSDMLAILRATNECCRDSVDAAVDDDWLTPVILDASSDSKLSRHVIFPNLVFAGMDDLKNFVTLVLQRIDATHPGRDGLGIDSSVYTSNRLFRIIGSTKKAKVNAVPFRLLDDPDAPLTPALFFRTLISPFRSRDYPNDDVLSTIPTIERVFKCEPTTKRPRSSPVGGGAGVKRMKTLDFQQQTIELSDREWNAVVSRTERYLRRTHSEVKQCYVKRSGDSLEMVLSPGIPCPNNNNAAHKSNKTWFSLSLKNGWSRYTCCDPMCRRHRWGNKKLDDLVRNEFS